MIYCFWNATCKLSGVFVCRFVSLLDKRRKDHEAKKAAAAAAAGDGEQGLSSTTRSSQTTGKCLCSYYFPLYSACSHLTLRGHVTSNNEILFPPKVSDSAAKFSFTSARSLITWHLTVKLFSVKSLRISSLFVNFVVAEIFPGNGLLTSKSETVFSKLCIWTMTLEDENALLPSNVERDFRCYIGSTYVFVVSYNKTFPFFILYTTP